jgi:hypothetical protein
MAQTAPNKVTEEKWTGKAKGGSRFLLIDSTTMGGKKT